MFIFTQRILDQNATGLVKHGDIFFGELASVGESDAENFPQYTAIHPYLERLHKDMRTSLDTLTTKKTVNTLYSSSG